MYIITVYRVLDIGALFLFYVWNKIWAVELDHDYTSVPGNVHIVFNFEGHSHLVFAGNMYRVPSICNVRPWNGVMYVY